MNRHRLFLLLGLTTAVVGAVPAPAQEKAATGEKATSWVGEAVLYTKPIKDIKFIKGVDGKEIDSAFSGLLPIKVREDRDGKLRIHDGHREGWVDKADFVLAHEAPAYFDKHVQADPKDTFALFMRAGIWRRANPIRPSTTTASAFASILPMRPPSAVAASPGSTRRSTTRRSRITMRPSAWTR